MKFNEIQSNSIKEIADNFNFNYNDEKVFNQNQNNLNNLKKLYNYKSYCSYN